MKLAAPRSGISFPATIAATLALAGCAAGPRADEHAAHHPPGAPAAAAAPTPGQVDSMMKSMHEMHQKMKAAKTPQERSALMSEHMKLMHEGMAMMGRMRGSHGGAGAGHDLAASPGTMGRRMDMMEMMMQMMMDRDAPAPPSGR